MEDSTAWKRAAAEAAIDYVRAGMVLGLGTGSTASCFMDALGARVRQGLDVRGVATSEDTAQQARACGVKLMDLPAQGVDLAVDGADEIDPELSLIKGGGGALLREKIVAASASAFLVIADARKCVARLGRFPLPIEVTPFGVERTQWRIRHALQAHDIDADCALRMQHGAPARSDNGGWIVDAACGAIQDARAVDQALRAIPGVVETGLFLNMADLAIVADADGVRAWTPQQAGGDPAP